MLQNSCFLIRSCSICIVQVMWSFLSIILNSSQGRWEDLHLQSLPSWNGLQLACLQTWHLGVAPFWRAALPSGQSHRRTPLMSLASMTSSMLYTPGCGSCSISRCSKARISQTRPEKRQSWSGSWLQHRRQQVFHGIWTHWIHNYLVILIYTKTIEKERERGETRRWSNHLYFLIVGFTRREWLQNRMRPLRRNGRIPKLRIAVFSFENAMFLATPKQISQIFPGSLMMFSINAIEAAMETPPWRTSPLERADAEFLTSS